MSEGKILIRGIKQAVSDHHRRKNLSRNEMVTRGDKKSLAAENKEVSGLASEIMSRAQAFDCSEDSLQSRDLAVSAVDDMIKGWEGHELEDLSSGRWPAAKQAEVDPKHEARKAAEKAADEFAEKWVEKPFNFLFGAVAVALAIPLSAALAVAASPVLVLLAGGEWACRKLGMAAPEAMSDPTGRTYYRDGDCYREVLSVPPWFKRKKQPIADRAARSTIAPKENSSVHLQEAKARKSVTNEAKALVERASGILKNSKSPKALPGDGGSEQ